MLIFIDSLISKTYNDNEKVYINYELSEIPKENITGKAKVYVNNKIIFSEDIYAELKKKKKYSFWRKFKIW